MSDLRSRLPAQSLMQRTLELHPASFHSPSGDALSWYTGALGEIAVAGVLAWLGPEWTVLHSVPVGRGDTDIDHVVIGPAGVFTINTKSHPGQKIWIAGHGLLVSGHGTNYIGLATSEAARAEKLLSAACGLTVPVTPVIALVNPGERTVKSEPEGGVRVVADWELLAALQGRREFSAEQVETIVAAAILPGTWHANPAPEADSRMLAIHFNAIMARAHQGAMPAPQHNAPSLLERPVPVSRVRRNPPTLRIGNSSPRRSGNRRKRRSSKGSETIAKLIALGVMLWVFYAAVLPAWQASLTP